MNLITITTLLSKLDIPKILGKKLLNNTLAKAITHLNENIDVEKVISGTYVLSILVGLVAGTSIWLIIKNFVISLLIGVIIFYLTRNYVLNRLTNPYLEKIDLLYKYSDLVIEDFMLAYNSTQSIFDSIEFVAEGNYPYLSDEFKKIIGKINYGYPPEDLLVEFAVKQPSETFKSFILLMLHLHAEEDSINKIIELNRLQTQMNYEKFTMQIESRIMIVVGLTVFLPLIISLTTITWGLANTPIILSLILMQLALMHILTRKLLKSKMKLLGT